MGLACGPVGEIWMLRELTDRQKKTDRQGKQHILSQELCGSFVQLLRVSAGKPLEWNPISRNTDVILCLYIDQTGPKLKVSLSSNCSINPEQKAVISYHFLFIVLLCPSCLCSVYSLLAVLIRQWG